MSYRILCVLFFGLWMNNQQIKAEVTDSLTVEVEESDWTGGLDVSIPEGTEATKMGDVNGDGLVSIADAVATVNYIMGTPNDPFIKEAADMNGDNSITIADVVAIIVLMME